jgi:hypothetical protein
MKRTGYPHMGCVDGKYKQNGKTTRARRHALPASLADSIS